jgi:hypothetical protein
MKKIFYEKVGRKYVPVYEYDQTLLDAFPKGNHIVMCYPGGQSRVYNIEPNIAAMIAASRYARDAMHEAIHNATKMHRENSNKVLTPEQKEAWENFVEVMGESGRILHYKSVHDIAEAGLKSLEKEAESLMNHPAVRDAYEQFLLVCKLTKEKV